MAPGPPSRVCEVIRELGDGSVGGPAASHGLLPARRMGRARRPRDGEAHRRTQSLRGGHRARRDPLRRRLPHREGRGARCSRAVCRRA